MNCVRCKILREQDLVCRACGYRYLSQPDERIAPDMPWGSDPNGPLAVIREFKPQGVFEYALLLFMTGTNATAVAVAGLVVMTATVLGASFGVRAAGVTVIVGVAAVGFDLLARLMLRCSLGDMTRGSQLLHVPVWVLGVVLVVIAGVLILAR